MAIAVFQNRGVVRAALLSGATAVGDGEWIDITGVDWLSIDISGITSATVVISGSNDPTIPANNTHGRQLNGVAITADQIFLMTSGFPLRWLKARPSVYASGTIYANMEGHLRGR